MNSRQHQRIRLLLVGIAVALGSFLAGYEVSFCRHQDRVFMEGRRQMLEAMVNLIRAGIIEVNEDRLRDIAVSDAGTNEVVEAVSTTTAIQ